MHKNGCNYLRNTKTKKAKKFHGVIDYNYIFNDILGQMDGKNRNLEKMNNI